MATGKAEPRGPKGSLYKLAEQAPGKLSDKVLKDACEFQLKNGGLAADDDTEMVNLELNPVWWFAIARAQGSRHGKSSRFPIVEAEQAAQPFAPTLSAGADGTELATNACCPSCVPVPDAEECEAQRVPWDAVYIYTVRRSRLRRWFHSFRS